VRCITAGQWALGKRKNYSLRTRRRYDLLLRLHRHLRAHRPIHGLGNGHSICQHHLDCLYRPDFLDRQIFVLSADTHSGFHNMATASGCYLMVRSCPHERRRSRRGFQRTSLGQGVSIPTNRIFTLSGQDRLTGRVVYQPELMRSPYLR
jgi:hypothetical protein